MRLLRYSSSDGSEKFGIYSGGKVADLSSSYPSFADMIADLPSLKARRSESETTVDNASILPPVGRCSKILCMAENYRSHIRERQKEPAKEPILFTKFYSSLTGPYSQIPLTGISEKMDYEGELVVMIGRHARNVKREDAWDHIAGYTLLNDVSARSLFRVPQGKGVMLDWFSCKALDRSTPVGPWVVSRDEGGDFEKLHVETFLNGVKVQSGDVSDMVFDVPKIIEHVTSRITLEPGDIISTGTPAGVGDARNRTLVKGDVVRVQAEGLGFLENHVG